MLESANIQQKLEELANPEKAQQPEEKRGRARHFGRAFGDEYFVQGLAPPNFVVVDTVGKKSRKSNHECKCPMNSLSVMKFGRIAK